MREKLKRAASWARRHVLSLVAVGASIAASCASCHVVVPPSPVAPHPTPTVADTEMCDAAEQRLVQLGCPEGKPTKRGERFGDVCRELQGDGIFVNPRCLASVADCDHVDVCTSTRAAP